ncbi:MAG: acetate--CoA ligase family protein [Pseudomonadota bacterium]
MGKRDLSRLLRPTSIAVVGGGAWCHQVVRQLNRMGYSGRIHRVHPVPEPVEGIVAVPRIGDLPEAPDAVFLGINRHATLEAVAALSSMGAGGVVCFASGFAEAVAEDFASATLQAALVEAAGDMPVLGPNCYGFVNAVDRALLWPDQHGCKPVDRGVAILAQSSNIAINLTMQQRGLPIAYVITCGNMAQTSQVEIATALLDDPRVTAIGLHVEGFGDVQAWHAFALAAEARGVPVIVLKVGASDQAQRATLTHTASLAGTDAGADALLAHLGIPRLHDLPAFLGTLMLLHCNGFLDNSALSSISCSGGEASLVADMATGLDVSFPDLQQDQKADLAEALGPMVALSNPLDYHTYVWGQLHKMTAAWLPMAAAHIGFVLIVLDYPHTDASAWEAATEAAIAVRRDSGRPVAVVSSLPELLPEAVAERLLAHGVTPLHGLREALAAAEAAGTRHAPQPMSPLAPGPDGVPEMTPEMQAKARLSAFGLAVPKSVRSGRDGLSQAAPVLRAPLVLKAEGLVHKSEAGGVKVNLSQGDLVQAAQKMPGDSFLVEEMVLGASCELLLGVTRDPAHGFVLTIGAGGVLTELWQDRVSMLLPVAREDVAGRLRSLRIYPLLTGYRGAAPAEMARVLDAVMALQDFVVAEANTLYEVEINPLMCTPDDAVAVDALIAALPAPDP